MYTQVGVNYSGGFFFADIQNNQVDAAGLAILRFIAALGEGYGFQVELIRQWFAQK